MAKETLENAWADLDDAGEENYKDATLIMQLLLDNLILWGIDEGILPFRGSGDTIPLESLPASVRS